MRAEGWRRGRCASPGDLPPAVAARTILDAAGYEGQVLASGTSMRPHHRAGRRRRPIDAFRWAQLGTSARRTSAVYSWSNRRVSRLAVARQAHRPGRKRVWRAEGSTPSPASPGRPRSGPPAGRVRWRPDRCRRDIGRRPGPMRRRAGVVDRAGPRRPHQRRPRRPGQRGCRGPALGRIARCLNASGCSAARSILRTSATSSRRSTSATRSASTASSPSWPTCRGRRGGSTISAPARDRLALVETAVGRSPGWGEPHRARSGRPELPPTRWPSWPPATRVPTCSRSSARTPPPASGPGSGTTRSRPAPPWSWWSGRAGARPPGGFDWVRVEVPHLEVSSTDLQAGRGRAPARLLLPPAVIDGIRHRQLYGVPV
jgi:hypothetical protein